MSEFILFSDLEDVTTITNDQYIHIFIPNVGNFKMKASDFAIGVTVEINSDGFWVINGNVTSFSAIGESPSIGVDGNWYIGNVDTGVKAGQEYYTTDYNHDVIGSRDGTNTTFYPTSNFKEGSIRVYKSGLRMSRGGSYDYVEDLNGSGVGVSVTFTIAPAPNENIIFEYIKV